jgi:hypothetical protein
MANPVNINVGALQRPGVFVTQSSTGGLPQPLASHAIGYIFGSTPVDPYDENPLDEYSSLPPYLPTQVGSLQDWIQKAGGIPTAANNPKSIASYDSVKAFFENVGVNGILYYTRVTPTPESKVIVTKAAGWNLFSLKVGDRYFGDKSLGINDSDGVEIRVITTTALDASDNAFDIVGYLSQDDPDFKTFYRIEQTDEEAKKATFRIYSKDVRVIPTIQSFKGYQISDTAYATPTDAGTISRYVPIKELDFRCIARDVSSQEPVLPISGSAIGNFLEETSVTGKTASAGSFTASTGVVTMGSGEIAKLSIGADALAAGDKIVFEGINPGQAAYNAAGELPTGNIFYSTTYVVLSVSGDTFIINNGSGAALTFTSDNALEVRVRRLAYDPAVQADVFKAIEDFLLDQEIYAADSNIPDNKIVAVTTDERVGKDDHIKWSDGFAAYYQWDAGTTAFTAGAAGGGLTEVPNGTITSVGGNVTRTGYVPDSVQVFYVNIAGENRVIIANGATPDEITADIVKSLKEVIAEKELDPYYEVDAVSVDYSGLGAGNFAPNNGTAISISTANAGKPALRPTNDGKALTGTIATTASNTTIQGSTSAQSGTIQLLASGALLGSGTDFLSSIAPGYRLLIGSATYEVVTVSSNTQAIVSNVAGATVAASTSYSTVTTKFTESLYTGSYVVINGYRFQVASVTNDSAFVVTSAPAFTSSSTTVFLDSSIANGFYRHDYILKVKITSKNGIPSPVVPGLNRYGQRDTNVVRINSLSEAADFSAYKLSSKARAQDFVYAIEQGMGASEYRPGFLFAPEAFTSFKQETGVLTKKEAREERVKVSQALLRAAEGKLGEVEGISGTQHIALIDCGADELSLSEVQDELAYVKSTAGAPFGHGAFYAPYIKNAADRFVPPSAYIAGIACSRYVNEGFQQSPAGARYPLRGANGLRFDITAQQQEVTYPLGLNPIRSLPNRGIVAWGARTMSPNALFKFVNTRAILNVLLDVMARSFDDVLFEQIDSAGTLYSRAKSIASQVMGQLYRQGALFGARPEQAYLVVCSDANNSLADLENGTLRLDAYVATSPTLERLVVTVVRTPAGQVAQVQDSFSRNVDRFDYLLNQTTV